ncbi:hypothetical protein ACRN9A_19455 [Shewanella frigidimarina]|uniref:hypothetical protein n=1 Tax=Shewanella frigidimarina TaxID=56812 RepID=UPI003D7B50F9
MEVDFFKDLELEIKEKLSEFGYPIPSFVELRKQHFSATEAHLCHRHYDIKNLVLHFLTVTERRIPIKKWNIHISPQLKNRTEIVNIESMLSKGEDVNPFLSKQVKGKHQNKKTDLLRFEWGIYHIHLEEGGKGDEMLFVYFDGNEAYLLDILLHEKDGAEHITWTNTDLIQILHDNWPHVIEGHIYGTDSKETLTPEQHRNARKNGCVTFVTVKDATEYMPMGGGFTSSKHPAMAVIGADRLVDKVNVLEQWTINNEQQIKSALKLNDNNIEVRLVLDSNYNPYVYEVTQKAVLNLLPPNQEPIN